MKKILLLTIVIITASCSSHQTAATTSGDASRISVYNSTAQANDVYVMKGDSVAYIKTVSEQDNYNRGPKKDSLNPHGTSNVGMSTVVSAIGEFFSALFD